MSVLLSVLFPGQVNQLVLLSYEVFFILLFLLLIKKHTWLYMNNWELRKYIKIFINIFICKPRIAKYI